MAIKKMKRLKGEDGVKKTSSSIKETPLLLFIYFIVMEYLNVTIQDAKELGLLNDLKWVDLIVRSVTSSLSMMLWGKCNEFCKNI